MTKQSSSFRELRAINRESLLLNKRFIITILRHWATDVPQVGTSVFPFGAARCGVSLAIHLRPQSCPPPPQHTPTSARSATKRPVVGFLRVVLAHFKDDFWDFGNISTAAATCNLKLKTGFSEKVRNKRNAGGIGGTFGSYRLVRLEQTTYG